MAREARALEGTHDFAAFRTAADARPTTVRTLSRVAVERIERDERILSVIVEGNAFLHNMVRILVGTLVVPRNTHGRGIIELVEPRSGKDHGGRLSISVESLDLGDGRAIPIALPPVESALHIGDQSDAVGVPRYGAVVVLDADESGNVVLHKGETFAVITTSTGTPQPIPHTEST